MGWLLVFVGSMFFALAAGSAAWLLPLMRERGRALPPPPDFARLARECGPGVVVEDQAGRSRLVLAGEPLVTARRDGRSWVIEARVVPLGAVRQFTVVRDQRAPKTWLAGLLEPQRTEVADALAACFSSGEADSVSMDDDGALRAVARELTGQSLSDLLGRTRALAQVLRSTRPALEADLSSARSPSSSPISVSADVSSRDS